MNSHLLPVVTTEGPVAYVRHYLLASEPRSSGQMPDMPCNLVRHSWTAEQEDLIC